MTKRFTIALVALALFVLVAVMPASAAYYNTSPVINQGATVFIGEQGLNLTHAIHVAEGTANVGQIDSTPVNTSIGWWASAATITSSAPTKSIDLASRYQSLTVAPSDFVGYPGNWYLLNGSAVVIIPGRSTPLAVIVAADPTLDVKIWDFNQATDMTGKSVPQGEYLGFRIETNMYPALDARYRSTVYGDRDVNPEGTGNGVTTSDGYLDIKVKDESGTTYTALYYGAATDGLTNTLDLVRQNVTAQPYTWGDMNTWMANKNWSTGKLVNGQYAYPVGTYTVTVESKLNNMKDNYKNAGADYTGKTVSSTQTIQLVSDTLKIEANKDSVVRSKPFSVTITGKPNTLYHVWVKGTSTMGGGYDDQPPFVNANQDGVKTDAYNGAGQTAPFQLSLANASGYVYQNGAGLTVWADVAHGTYNPTANPVVNYQDTLGNGSFVNANVTTSVSGTRTVEFITTNWTKAQKYTIRVEKFDGAQYKSDEVDVKVEKGAVTIVAAGDQSYYLGEEIKLSGTNTETYKTYLFLVGPNLPTNGANIAKQDPRNFKVTSGDVNSFQAVDVQGDNTWSWKWGTSSYALDAGSYTIYAVSQPKSKDDLSQAAYGTVSIVIKKPFVSATASQSTVAQGDQIFITGTAEGQPSKGVQIWVLGKNYPKSIDDVKTQSVNSDGSFKYEITRSTTTGLYQGQYFVVVQHPMQNTIFDVVAVQDGSNVVVKNMQLGVAGVGTKVFTLLGAGSLQGSDAAEALVQGINDPNVDDTYTKLQFIVETPKITIAPISDKHVGDKFTITATTNMQVDDDVLVQVVSSSFKPTQKSQSGEFSGAGQTIKVKKGDSGLNTLSIDVDASSFKPDEYLVTMSGVLVVASDSALFNVLEGTAPTAVPSVTATAVAPVTTAATIVPVTTVPTPVPTTKSPGYGALIALIGLGAVAFIVVRRH